MSHRANKKETYSPPRQVRVHPLLPLDREPFPPGRGRDVGQAAPRRPQQLLRRVVQPTGDWQAGEFLQLPYRPAHRVLRAQGAGAI